MSVEAAKPSPEAPRRGVRRTRRGTERCAQIRATAIQLFLEHGYDGVSVDEIVRTVGGSKTNVYNHFRNKEGLFAAVVKGLTEEFLASFIAMDVSALGLEEGLRKLALALLGILLDERHLALQRLIVAEAVRFPGLGRDWFESGPERSRSIIAQFIEEQQRAGGLRPSDPHQCATLFHDMVTFDLLHRAMLVDRPSDDAIRSRVEVAIEGFLHGFARR
jgi:AcrR family transcriptional regulator